jgi:serine-type D-Ala-D-Ala carboxypeptidase (penicillin-binding protein 5/6)
MKKLILLIVTIVILTTFMVPKAFGQSEASPPKILSEAAIMIDSKTGTVLYEKNADKHMYPASLTKIATAIYAIETGNLEDVVTVSENARNIDGTRVYLEAGEKVTLKKLLQGLLINSGNDAGVAIAEHLNGSIDEFSSEINKYLKNKIGIKNTNFENPHGLYDPNHVTTPEDLAKITQYAMKNEVFRKIFGTKELKWDGESWDTTIYAHHKMLREIPYEGITGGKTGFVNESGFTLATTAKRENLSLIVITMKNNTQTAAYKDTANLLDYGFDNFESTSITKGTVFKSNGQEYKVPKKLYYTNAIDSEIKKEVTKDGSLEIHNTNGNIIDSFKLESVIKKDTLNKKNPETNAEPTNSLVHPVFIVLVIAIFIVAFVYRKFSVKMKHLANKEI